MNTTVSVVIPTVGRIALQEAVKSTLEQTVPVSEVFVVADTADPIDLPDDPRVQLLRVGPRAGGNVARMAGIRAATSTLIALLDDDDQWKPNKIEDQLASLPSTLPSAWVCTARVIDTDGAIRPVRSIGSTEKLGDYVFKQTQLKDGLGKIHTSSILAPRQLLLDIPLDESLRFHQDTDWLARVAALHPSIPVIQPQDPLVECEASDDSVASRIKWRESVAWAREALRDNPRWLGDFVLSVPLRFALAQEGRKAAQECLAIALRYGRPGAIAVITASIRILRFKNPKGRASSHA